MGIAQYNVFEFQQSVMTLYLSSIQIQRIFSVVKVKFLTKRVVQEEVLNALVPIERIYEKKLSIFLASKVGYIMHLYKKIFLKILHFEGNDTFEIFKGKFLLSYYDYVSP